MSLSRVPLALLVSSLAVPTFATAAPAQVPEGHAVVGTGSHQSFPGTPGLFVFPLDGGPTTQGTPITGLPPALSTAVGAGQQGTWAVSLRSSDGAIIVTTFSDPVAPQTQGRVELYVLHLSGSAVSQVQVIPLGTATANAAINHAQLPDGRILVHGGQGSNAPLAMGPMAGHWSAIVDPPNPNAVTVLPNPTSLPSGQTRSGGVAVDPSGRFFYLLQNATYHSNPAGGWTLLRQDLTPPFADCVIATDPNESAHGIRCDDDGTLYITSSSPTGGMHTHTLHPSGCNVLTLGPATANNGDIGAWGIDLDRASGMLVATSVRSGPRMGDLGLIDPTTGLRNVIGVAPPGGWGLIGNQGVAVNNAIDSYGPRSDGTNRYWFENFPNPSGQPYVSNTGFSLTMASAPGTALASAIALSFGRGSTNFLGAEVLVDLSSTVTQFVPPGPSVSYPLPIPNVPSLAGIVLTAQSLHLEAGNTLATSRGLDLISTLLPAPTIQAITPPSPLPGVTVTVDGTNFYSGMELRVAGNPTPIVTQAMQSLTFVMPTGVPCDSMVSLTNPGGASTAATINGTPIITTMTPNGPAAGGAIFSVSGQYLTGAIVTFNGVPMTNILAQGPFGIVGYTPPGTAGPATVLVTGPTGCFAIGMYTYL